MWEPCTIYSVSTYSDMQIRVQFTLHTPNCKAAWEGPIELLLSNVKNGITKIISGDKISGRPSAHCHLGQPWKSRSKNVFSRNSGSAWSNLEQCLSMHLSSMHSISFSSPNSRWMDQEMANFLAWGRLIMVPLSLHGEGVPKQGLRKMVITFHFLAKLNFIFMVPNNTRTYSIFVTFYCLIVGPGQFLFSNSSKGTQNHSPSPPFCRQSDLPS